MYSDHIPDDSITASSWLSSKHLPYFGRLDRNIGHGAWCSAPNDVQPYLEIDLEIEHMITGVITQGKHRLSSDQLGFAWVTEFFLSYTTNQKNWTFVKDVKTSQPIKFLGNDAVNWRKKTKLLGFTGRLVRFHPEKWNNLPCLRVELLGTKVCSAPLGMKSGEISNSAIRYSSSTSDHEGYHARLKNSHDWIPQNADKHAFLKIDFGSYKQRLTALAIQSGSGGFVTKFKLSYSVEGWSWRHWIEDAREKFFSGTENRVSIRRFLLPYPVEARYLLINLLAYVGNRATRIEVYGCTGDYSASKVGIQSIDKIANSSMTASSWKPGYYPYAARLSKSIGNGSWCAAATKQDEYLQVDLGKQYSLVKIGVQGDTAWGSGMKQFYIAYSRNGGMWTNYMIHGARKLFEGVSGDSVRRTVFERTFVAKMIRVIVNSWYSWPCLRMELYHTDCKNNLSFSLKEAKNGGYTASSFLGPGFEPWRGSILTSSKQHGWCAENSSTPDYLQIDLRVLNRVTGVLTRGIVAGVLEKEAWVKQYTVQHSILGDHWINHKEEGVVKTFDANADAVFSKSQVTNFYARFVRVIPKQWHFRPCMKVELQGCEECSSPLGMEHGEIAGDRIKTSMPISSNTNARLRCSRYSFLGSSQWEPFIQVDLGPENKRLTAFAMQGRDYTYNTWAVYVKYAVGDGSEWFNYTKNGETEIFERDQHMDMMTKHFFKRTLTTRFIRVLPLTWSHDVGLRIELYGCPVCENPLGIEGGLHNVTASSFRGAGHEPCWGRLNSAGIWRPYTNQIYEFLHVRFDHVMAIIGIATQGYSASCGRVKRFWLYHSLDGMRFELYNDPIMGDVSGAGLFVQ
ncbi:uncharacterized protein LOC111326284 [Stylophora pistillata]|uniref:uncharacterized protein LOC111326284 n=1 Tax=Stylophora pistillata TaxID=50429 RepID=UPI000C03BAA8|nr:uncharacterized protein LOC111326284 [Stylophora pistillata]